MIPVYFDGGSTKYKSGARRRRYCAKTFRINQRMTMIHVSQFISLVEKSLVSTKSLKKTAVKDVIGKLYRLQPTETDSNAVHDILVAIQSIARRNDECLLEKFCTCGLFDLIGKIFNFLQSWRNASESQECVAEQLLETLVALSECSQEVKMKILEDYICSSVDLLNQCTGKCRHAFEVLRDINILMEGCPLAVKEKMMRDEKFLENVKKLASTLECSGDYEFQVGLLEYLFRVIPRKQREERMVDFITNQLVCQEIAKIRDSEFETDCRQFLNNFNANHVDCPRVFSLPCIAAFLGNKELLKPNDPGYDSFWVDFNTGTERITLFCQQTFESQESIDDEWETLSLWKTDVLKYEILLTDELQVVNITLIKPIAELYPSQQNVEGKVLQIQFSRDVNIEEALELTFERERIQQKRKPRKVSAPTSPIYMRGQKARDFEKRMEILPAVKETDNIADVIPGSQTPSQTSSSSRKVSVPKIPMSSFLGKASTKSDTQKVVGSTPGDDRSSEASSHRLSLHPKKVSEPAVNCMQRREVIQDSVALYCEDNDVEVNTKEQETNEKALSQNSPADVDSVPDSYPVKENKTELTFENKQDHRSSAEQSLSSSQGSCEETHITGSKKKGRPKKTSTKMKHGRKKNVGKKKPRAKIKNEENIDQHKSLEKENINQSKSLGKVQSITTDAVLHNSAQDMTLKEEEIRCSTGTKTEAEQKESKILCNAQELKKGMSSSCENALAKDKVLKQKKKGGNSDDKDKTLLRTGSNSSGLPSYSENTLVQNKVVIQKEKGGKADDKDKALLRTESNSLGLPSYSESTFVQNKVVIQKGKGDNSDDKDKALLRTGSNSSRKLKSNICITRETRSKRNKMNEELACIINNFSASDNQKDTEESSKDKSFKSHLHTNDIQISKQTDERKLEHNDELDTHSLKSDTFVKEKNQGRKRDKTKRGLAGKYPEIHKPNVDSSSKSNVTIFGKGVDVPYNNEAADEAVAVEDRAFLDEGKSQVSADTASFENKEFQISGVHHRKEIIDHASNKRTISENLESSSGGSETYEDTIVLDRNESDVKENISISQKSISCKGRKPASKKIKGNKKQNRKKASNNIQDHILSVSNDEHEAELELKRKAGYEDCKIDKSQNERGSSYIENSESLEVENCSDSLNSSNSHDSIHLNLTQEEVVTSKVKKEEEKRKVKKPEQKMLVSDEVHSLEEDKQTDIPVEKKFGKIFKTKQWNKHDKISNFGFGSPDHIDSSGDSCSSMKNDLEKTRVGQNLRKSVLFYMSYSASKQQSCIPTPKGDAEFDPYDFDAECGKKASKANKKRDYSEKFYSKSYCMKSGNKEVLKTGKRGTKTQSKRKCHTKSPSLTFEVQKPFKSKLNNLKSTKKTEITCSKQNTPDSVRRKMNELNVIDLDEKLVTDEDVDLVDKSKFMSQKKNNGVNISFKENPIESDMKDYKLNQKNKWGNLESPVKVQPDIASSEDASPSEQKTRKMSFEEETVSANEELLSNFSKICKSIVTRGDKVGKRKEQSPAQHSGKSPHQDSEVDTYSSFCNSRSEVSWIAKHKSNRPKGKTYKKKKDLFEGPPFLCLGNDTPVLKLHTDETADEEEEEEKLMQKVDFAPKKPTRGKFPKESKDKVRRSLATDTPVTDVPDTDHSQQQTPISVQIMNVSLTSKEKEDIEDISSIKSFGSNLKTPQPCIETIDEEEDEEFTIPSNFKFQDIKGLVSGPSTRARTSKSSLKRKYQSIEIESESSQAPSEDTEDDLDLSRPRPRKLFKAHHMVEAEREETLEVLSTETEGSNVDTLTQKSFNMDIQCVDPGITSLMKSFSIDVNAQMQTKKKYLEVVSKDLLKTTQKQISQAWLDQQDYRSQIIDKFQDDLLKEVKDLDRDIDMLQEAEQKALVCFKQQLRVVEKSRQSQEHRVQNLLKLKDNFVKQLSKADKFSTQKQVSIKELMREKMGSLQKKLLLENQRHELASLKKNLQCVFMS